MQKLKKSTFSLPEKIPGCCPEHVGGGDTKRIKYTGTDWYWEATGKMLMPSGLEQAPTQ